MVKNPLFLQEVYQIPHIIGNMGIYFLLHFLYMVTKFQAKTKKFKNYYFALCITSENIP